VAVTTGPPGPGLGVRDAGGSPRRESSTSSKVVEPGLGLFRRRAAVAIASSVSLWPDPDHRFHAGVKKRQRGLRHPLGLESVHASVRVRVRVCMCACVVARTSNCSPVLTSTLPPLTPA